MTYSPGHSPGSSGYPPAQPGSYGAPTPAYGQPAVDAGPSKLPLYLTAAVAALGVFAYLFSYGPTYSFSVDVGQFGGAELTGRGGPSLLIALVVVLAAALLAGVGLLPKAGNHAPIVAVLAVVGVLLIAYQALVTPANVSVAWGLWTVLGLTFLQAVAAIVALLLEVGVLTAPAPRPKYEQPQYGQYGPPPGGYWGQAPGQPQGPPQHGGPQQGQRPGYPSQYGGGYPQGPSTGGFGVQGAPTQGMGAQNGPPTPPTGYPSFSPPPAVGPGQQQGSAQSSGQNQPQAPAPSPGPTPS